MAYATINFENPNTGGMKIAPVGFSWTTFFFGPFPALLRGHIGMGIVILVLAIITGGLSTLYFMFAYNKMYIKHLIQQGYKVDNASQDITSLESSLSISLPQK